MNAHLAGSRFVLTALFLCAAWPSESLAYGELDPAYKSAAIAGAACHPEVVAMGDGSAFVSIWREPSFWGAGKFLPDGSVDTGWGVGGAAFVRTSEYQIPHSMLPAKDGGLFLVQSSIVRLSRTGQLDSSYGSEGVSDYVRGRYQGSHSAALSPDGSVVVLARGEAGGQAHFVVTRFDPSGLRDLSFGAQGFLTVPIDPDRSTLYAWSLTAAGEVEVATYRVGSDGMPMPSLERYPNSFSSDPGYRPDNRLVPRGEANWMSPLAKVDPQGRLLIADFATPGPGVSVARFGLDARPDARFGDRGRTSLRIENFETERAPVILQYAKGLHLAPGGGWTVLMGVEHSYGGFSGFVDASTKAIRLRDDGSIDAEFAQGSSLAGWQQTQFAQLDDGSMLSITSRTAGCSLTKRLTGAPRAEAAMVEYHHPGGDHYFMTLDGFESGILDNNVAAMGWVRTGHSFGAWQPLDLPGATPVCRFYGDLKAGPNSHFYTSQKAECEGLRAAEAATPVGNRAWRLEGMTFAIADSPEGRCAANLAPVYRLYNNGVARGEDPNHRYTADLATYRSMEAKGWIGEGVRFCAPPVTPRSTRG